MNFKLTAINFIRRTVWDCFAVAQVWGRLAEAVTACWHSLKILLIQRREVERMR
tara:strand:- start:256 stop:417 length:162 start_codon:yes stop_codon:yes gene_type:complete